MGVFGEGEAARGEQLTTSQGREWMDIRTQEAKYIERWHNMTSAQADWSRFDIPVDRYGGVHSLLICTSRPLGSPTCH